MSTENKPFVPETTNLPEFTFKAIILGLLMAIVLGAANAYLGLKAGMTVSAMFPAAVVALAAFRLPFLRGSILEQNIARTTASVGEALVGGAIFTIPAFIMVKVGGRQLWTAFHYWDVTIILLIGGLLGILFITLLRRTLVEDARLPYPEGVACYEIVRTGQHGQSGAKYVFSAMGLGVLFELLKNPRGFAIIREFKEFFFRFPRSVISHFASAGLPYAKISHTGGLALHSPAASPALIGVGYIIGPKYSGVAFAGSILAWLVFIIPLVLFLNLGSASAIVADGEKAFSTWYNLVRPIAVGAMLVSAFYTLWGLKGSLIKAVRGITSKRSAAARTRTRLEADLNFRFVAACALALFIPMVFLYKYFCGSVAGAVLSAAVMMITVFLFAAVGGWIVGLVGNTNQPVSGLTLSSLIIAALLMLAVGVKGLPGVAAVLGVAAVVCCAVALAGDMIQDLKVGQFVGGTPWKMELAEIIGVVVVAFVAVFIMTVLHEGVGIGGKELPAPQAGLMAQLATGIVGGQLPWGLILIGMCFALGLILIHAPAPMLIAVGMYLPFETTFAMFVGGAIKWTMDRIMAHRGLKGEGIEGPGILLASGFVAGEAITGVLLAALVFADMPSLGEFFFGVKQFGILDGAGGWLSLTVFATMAFCLIWIPLKRKG